MTSHSKAFADQRFAAWEDKHGWRLEAMHPDVAAEIRSTVRQQLYAGEHSGMTDEDRQHCLMRVASRMRIKGGNIPAGEAGSGEQLRAIVDQLAAPRARAAA